MEQQQSRPAIPPELRRLRESIDNIDAALIHLLAERFKCTKAVGELKAREGLPPAGAARFATVAASLSVTRTGAQPSMARRTEIDAAMRRYGQGFPA